jgi:hypothetical protein
MLTAAGRATQECDHPAPALRGRAGSQCRRYAKFGALTNQPLSRPSTVHCTAVVRADGSLHLPGACRGANFPRVGPCFTVPLDLGAAPCLQMDEVYSKSISGPTGSHS